MMSTLQFLRHLRGYLRFLELPADRKRLVIYSEGAASWPHLGPVVETLLARNNLWPTYVTSSDEDPGAKLIHPRLSIITLGCGHLRTLFFNGLQAEMLLMTMPDLQTFHIKRSPRTLHYAYLHHSMVSSHMAYRFGAFDHFDSILCTGPHHTREIRAMEAERQLPAKQLIAHGYGRLDSILATSKLRPPPGEKKVILVAPSWGPAGLLELHVDTLLQQLAPTEFEVIVRPHPQTAYLRPDVIQRIHAWSEASPNIQLDRTVVGHETLSRASLMISDWSGAAFDFALGMERPVLFIDVPRKVNNAGYESLGIDPIEAFGRRHLGDVMSSSAFNTLAERILDLLTRSAELQASIARFRTEWVHNIGRSDEAAADWIESQLTPELAPTASALK